MILFVISSCITIGVLLWWAAKPLNTNHAENDEAAYERNGQ